MTPAPRLSANLSFLFTDRPLAQRFSAAAANGFEAVECNDLYSLEPQVVAELLDSTGLRLVLINVGTGSNPGDLGTAAIPGRETETADLFAQALDYAKSLGKPMIHYLTGRRPPDVTFARADQVFLESLARDAELAASQGVMLTLEPLNPVDRPDYHLLSLDHAQTLIEVANKPNIGLQLDLYHCAARGEDLIDALEKVIDRLAHVQIAGAPGRHEPGGLVDHAAAMAHLIRLGYGGFVGCEYVPKGDTALGLAWARPYLAQRKGRSNQ